MKPDGELFLRWIRGDMEAADELSARHYWRVHRFFELKAPSMAEDLTQQTFLACTEARERYLQMGSFSAFLFGIARRQLLLYLRSRGVRERWVDFENRDAPGTGPTPSGLVAMAEEQRILLLALAALPLHLQMTVQLHYWEGLKSAEIGKALGIPTSTVTTRLARARKVMRERIAKHPRERPRTALLQDLEKWARSLAGSPVPKMFSRVDE